MLTKIFIEDDTAILFMREFVQMDEYISHFSVPTARARTARSRVVVVHEGGNDGLGSWVCSKDGIRPCAHITEAKDQLQRVITSDPNAKATEGPDEEDPGVASLGISIVVQLLSHSHNFLAAPKGRLASRDRDAVSYLPILPPVWATIITDEVLYQ